MKSSFLAVFFLGAAVVACSGTTDKTGAGGDGGEEVTTSTGSSSSSGMGGEGGNGSGGGGGSGGSAPAIKADKLGQVCNLGMQCPMGYSCVLLPSSMTNGFCTIPCPSAGDMTVCGTANGFPGPGVGVCSIKLQNQPGFYCGVVCGTQYSLPDTCPTGLTCADTIDAMAMMPGMDGKTDLCVP